MWERFEKSGWFAFGASLGMGCGLTYLAGTDLAAAYWRGLSGVRWWVWAWMAGPCLVGASYGWRLGRRLYGQRHAEPSAAPDGDEVS